MQKCSYCGLLKEYTDELDEGKFICGSCKEIVNKEGKIIVNKKNRNLQSPLHIKKELDKFIVKQEEAKVVLATEAYNHLKRTKIKELENTDKNNILLVGPSGCGKTYLVETMAKIINVPMVVVNATEFSASGYVGKTVSQIGRYLLDKAGGDITAAEKGIVFIDEIDKIAGFASGHDKDVGGVEVQKELLKVIEGEELHINDEQDLFGSLDGDIVINTKNILFIFSGAFENLQKTDIQVNILTDKKQKEIDITPELLIKNGFLKEFIGRIPLICKLEDLDIEDMIEILATKENNLLSQYKKMFAYDNIELEFSEDAITEIARQAYEKKIGARGLKAILGNIMNKILYQAYEKKVSKIIITREKLMKILGKKYNVK